MAKETIQAVHQAEFNAISKEKDALRRKDIIISEAEQKAKVLISSMTKQAMEKAKNDLSDANQKGQTMIESSKEKASDEINVLKSIAQTKELGAVQLILSLVI